MILQHNFDDLSVATGWLETLEKHYVVSGVAGSKRDAWEEIAENARITVGSVEGIARNRVKDVSTRVYRALQGLLERELSNEIKRLERELENARSAGLRPNPSSLSQAEAALADARAALHAQH